MTAAPAHTTPAPASAAAPVHHRHKHVEMARWSSIMLILFIIALPFLNRVDSSGAFVHFLREWMFVVFVAYMAIQFWETANRSSVNSGGFFEDNGIAFIAVLIGFGIFVLLISRSIIMTEDQIVILLQCLGWGGLDFVLGLVISQRIASSAKERDEE